ncbi:DNA ligase D [Oxalobacteraceae bacterium OM1]|nr:DNA ligase D [Oxalobacteraceae bacterium OM1]
MATKLSTYHAKRDFGITPEPRGAVVTPGERLRFVVQKHDARRLHYDFRLEFDGTLKSWAVPKGPSLDPAEKRLAVHVEDHPLDYIDFEGDIPEHQYGAGHVDVWDIGWWEPLDDPAASYKAGKMKFRLHGEKLHGGWTLVRTRLQASGDKEQWLLIKERDDEARAHAEYDITAAEPDSVLNKPKPKPAKRARAAKGTKAKPAKKGNGKDEAPEILIPRALTNAKRAALPETLSPQLATLVDAPPEGGEWEYEIKFDGYRLLAQVDNYRVRLYTRDGKDWTERLPKQAEAIRALGLKTAWLDGEIVVLDENSVPSFQRLQNAFDASSTAQIIYFAFDLPYLDGYDLRAAPLRERRALLEQIMRTSKHYALRYSAPIDQPAEQLLDSACKMQMEGIIGKMNDSPYIGKRSASWIKLKCRRRQEFVIVGYTEPQGTRMFFGALLLGVYDDKGVLHYAGKVGTGFDRDVLRSTYERLHAREINQRPVDRMPPGVRRADTHWVKPELVAEVSFAEWTEDGMLRQAVFHGLRADKKARDVRREEAVHARPVGGDGRAAAAEKAEKAETKDAPRAPAAKRGGKGDAMVEGVKITHPDRVIDPSTGFTKLDLAHYYAQVAQHMLPTLHDRPVYLLRCPEGIPGEHFFQKHAEHMVIPGVELLDPALDPDHKPYMAINTAHALAGAAQMGAIELHTCSATADRIDRPDFMVFDLDPDPGLPWQAVAEAARLTKVVLDELGLQSFLKTSGGKGLHIVVPLSRRNDWETVTAFSQAVAQHMAKTIPSRFSAKMGKQNRVGKVFIDYLRNQRQASTIAVFAARARPGMGVSTPILWEELDQVNGGDHWNIETLPQRLATLQGDPWEEYAQTRQSITAAMQKTLGLKK